MKKMLVSFEKIVPVSSGKFEYTIENIKIPEGFNNFFTVETCEAKNLDVRVKKIIWVTKSSEASRGTAIVSRSNVPPGTYRIKIDGNAERGHSKVNLKIKASQKVKVDSNGSFNCSYDTTAIPPGNFKINVGSIKKEITLKHKK